MLFKIGVVGENVNKILHHSVAVVVLLLEGEGRGRRSVTAVVPNNANVNKLTVSAQQV